MKHLVIGLFAQVDAGKTTLSEALLYQTGSLRTVGRVDHGDAFLDHFSLERSRGITIFSKQARFQTDDLSVVLLDTPGHIDFSPEAERTMQVLDYAVLLISGTDGVQPHTQTLFRLLRRYHIPTFLFFNKMDLPGAEEAHLLADAASHLDPRCLRPDDSEAVALCDEALLEHYLERGTISDAALSDLCRRELLFPCYFGSALRGEGVSALLDGLKRLTVQPTYPSDFSACVYKIAYDTQRLTFLKVTGGTLRVRSALHYLPRGKTEPLEEKVTQLRRYSGAAFRTVEEVRAGDICAVTGLSSLLAGDTLGTAAARPSALLCPVMTYHIRLPEGTDVQTVLPLLRRLEDEEPQLHIDEKRMELQLMGQVQLEVLQSLILERYALEVTFDCGTVAYRETIADTVEGVGHYEPLRHYAEVHLLLSPLPRGSGLQFDTDCSEDLLDRNWQRLILTHLREKTHRGVLTGAPITDMRITLRAGRAHLKHTEGGDFRQATYRAVRQGLMQAHSVLLEPFYRFRLEVPPEQIGRAIGDIRAMGGSFASPVADEELMYLTGEAPAAQMQDYMAQVVSYTRGKGRLFCEFSGYAPCHNAQQVIEQCAYDPLRDPENTPDSVFCAHGGGFPVKWNEVPAHMHLESVLPRPNAQEPERVPRVRTQNLDLDEKELARIIEREFGPDKRVLYRPPAPVQSTQIEIPTPKTEYLIVDGYNMIFTWDGLRDLAKTDLSGARERLLDILSNYCGYHPCELVVVFDSYRVKGGVGSRTTRDKLRIVYTKENESADLYIESLVGQIGKNYAVRVATSDAMIQLSALRSGVLRVSATELLAQIECVNDQIAEMIKKLREEARRASIAGNPLKQIRTEELS